MTRLENYKIELSLSQAHYDILPIKIRSNRVPYVYNKSKLCTIDINTEINYLFACSMTLFNFFSLDDNSSFVYETYLSKLEEIMGCFQFKIYKDVRESVLDVWKDFTSSTNIEIKDLEKSVFVPVPLMKSMEEAYYLWNKIYIMDTKNSIKEFNYGLSASRLYILNGEEKIPTPFVVRIVDK